MKDLIILNEHFPCQRYYSGEGGKKIGITANELIEHGIDDQIYVHRDLIPMLNNAREHLKKVDRGGFGICVTEGWWSIDFYNLIKRKREAKHLPVSELFNLQEYPRTTGKCISATLTLNNRPIRLDDPLLGEDALKLASYRQNENDRRMSEFYRKIRILHLAMSRAGFRLGSRGLIYVFCARN